MPSAAHTRTSLARESDSAGVPMSQTPPFVGRHAHACVVKLIRTRLPSQARRARLVRVWAPLDRAAAVTGMELADTP
jgi:hypothetical protein